MEESECGASRWHETDLCNECKEHTCFTNEGKEDNE